MEIKVQRQACCSADDQMGPLQAMYEVDENSPISALIEEISVSRFLQYSSTHNRLSGEIDGTCIVEAYPGGWKLNADVNPQDLVGSLVGLKTYIFVSFT